MKKLMRILAAVMALAMALSVVTVSAFAEEEEGELSGGYLPIGSTPYSIKVPAGYYDAGVTEEDVADDMISTYVSDDSDLAFDVYEFDKSEKYPDVATFMTADCEAYKGTELTLDGKINGVKMASYRSADEYNGTTYNDMNYAFEYGEKIIQIDFYWQDAASEGMAEQIMSTFHMGGVQQISVGLSGYSIMIPKEFDTTELAEEEYELGLVSGYTNPYSGLEIETGYFMNLTDASVQEVAAAQAEAYNGTLLDETEINGIPMAEYVAVETYDGVEYTVYVALVQDEIGAISTVSFYLNNYCAYVQAEAYMHTLNVYDESKNIPLEATKLQLGSSGYEVTLPCGFVAGIVPWDEYNEDGLLGAYTSPYTDIAIDVYQCYKEDEEASELAAFTEIDAAKYSGTEIDLSAEINGIPMTCYRSVETYDEIEYECLNYTFEACGIYFVQLCFYWQGDDLTEDVEAIMNTIAPVATQDVTFGKNNEYKLTVASDTEVSAMLEEDDSWYATYLISESGAPTIVISTVANLDMLSLDAYAQQCCADYEATGYGYGETANGITIASFHYDYNEVAYGEGCGIFYGFLETNGTIYEIDVIVENYAQMEQARSILSTLKAA